MKCSNNTWTGSGVLLGPWNCGPVGTDVWRRCPSAAVDPPEPERVREHRDRGDGATRRADRSADLADRAPMEMWFSTLPLQADAVLREQVQRLVDDRIDPGTAAGAFFDVIAAP